MPTSATLNPEYRTWPVAAVPWASPVPWAAIPICYSRCISFCARMRLTPNCAAGIEPRSHGLWEFGLYRTAEQSGELHG